MFSISTVASSTRMHGEGESAEGHDVDGFAQGAQQNDGHENGERDGDGDNDGRTPVAQKEQDHGGGETGGDEAFAENSLNGSADEERLIEERSDGELRAQVGRQIVWRVFDHGFYVF